MKAGILFSMFMIGLLEVVRNAFLRSYGRPAGESPEYVLLLSGSLLLLNEAFPD